MEAFHSTLKIWIKLRENLQFNILKTIQLRENSAQLLFHSIKILDHFTKTHSSSSSSSSSDNLDPAKSLLGGDRDAKVVALLSQSISSNPSMTGTQSIQGKSNEKGIIPSLEAVHELSKHLKELVTEIQYEKQYSSNDASLKSNDSSHPSLAKLSQSINPKGDCISLSSLPLPLSSTTSSSSKTDEVKKALSAAGLLKDTSPHTSKLSRDVPSSNTIALYMNKLLLKQREELDQLKTGLSSSMSPSYINSATTNNNNNNNMNGIPPIFHHDNSFTENYLQETLHLNEMQNTFNDVPLDDIRKSRPHPNNRRPPTHHHYHGPHSQQNYNDIHIPGEFPLSPTFTSSEDLRNNKMPTTATTSTIMNSSSNTKSGAEKFKNGVLKFFGFRRGSSKDLDSELPALRRNSLDTLANSRNSSNSNKNLTMNSIFTPEKPNNNNNNMNNMNSSFNFTRQRSSRETVKSSGYSNSNSNPFPFQPRKASNPDGIELMSQPIKPMKNNNNNNKSMGLPPLSPTKQKSFLFPSTSFTTFSRRTRDIPPSAESVTSDNSMNLISDDELDELDIDDKANSSVIGSHYIDDKDEIDMESNVSSTPRGYNIENAYLRQKLAANKNIAKAEKRELQQQLKQQQQQMLRQDKKTIEKKSKSAKSPRSGMSSVVGGSASSSKRQQLGEWVAERNGTIAHQSTTIINNNSTSNNNNNNNGLGKTATAQKATIVQHFPSTQTAKKILPQQSINIKIVPATNSNPPSPQRKPVQPYVDLSTSKNDDNTNTNANSAINNNKKNQFSRDDSGIGRSPAIDDHRKQRKSKKGKTTIFFFLGFQSHE